MPNDNNQKDANQPKKPEVGGSNPADPSVQKVQPERAPEAAPVLDPKNPTDTKKV